MVQVALAPCSPFSVSQPVMMGSAELAEQLDVRLHTHLGETRDENAYCEDRLGMRPVDYLESCGWLSSRPLARTRNPFLERRNRPSGQCGSRSQSLPSLQQGPCLWTVPCLQFGKCRLSAGAGRRWLCLQRCIKCYRGGPLRPDAAAIS
ncbi:MAG: hypothetical protein Ct9H300mP16_14310 [Pseudomonadota bacterium]|nr:MAG: hypothetical protein Ct9H300mP16_14310 [Pseudomonadota bacterium]